MQLTNWHSSGMMGSALRSSAMLSFLLMASLPAQGQIRPDRTLPNNSTITPNGSTLSITDGTTIGTNLFHSFEQFSVLTGQTAFFNNALNVQNILARITGSNISQINGLIQANGNANLFLLNPNGMIFGPNAQLRIGGSFVGTTADTIILSDRTSFSAINPQAPSLLAVNVPLGLQFGTNPGSIINQSLAKSFRPLPPLNLPFAIPIDLTIVGLQVLPGKSLALIGGEVTLDGGKLTAYQGQVLLGSVNSGVVGLNFTPQGLSLNYDNIQNGNISLANGALINTSGLGGGRVEITGKNVALSDSQIYALTLGNLDGGGININAQNFQIKEGSKLAALTLANGQSGDIKIRATDSVEISGLGSLAYQQFLAQYLASGTANPSDPSIGLATGTYGTGKAGEIEIITPSLQLNNGAIVASSTFGTGNAGNLTIRANDFVLNGSALSSGALRGSSGKGGSINVSTQLLTMSNGAALSSISNSSGKAGNIDIQATESIRLLGSPPGLTVQTLIGTNALDSNGIGRAGDLTIDTKQLIVADGAGISSASGGVVGDTLFPTAGGNGGNLTIRATESVQVTGFSGVLANGGQIPSYLAAGASGNSRGGDVQITTPFLSVRDGGLISAASLGAGDAGDISINANRVEVIGSGANGKFLSTIEATVGTLFIFSNPNATTKAGSVNLNVGNLLVQDGARVTVSALGTGSAGNINLIGKRITLDQKASINASTVSGAGGNINLNSQDILLRRGSQISTNAGNTNGGNITIKTDNLVAVPVENSDITANAQKGVGGRISISADSILGIQFRDRLTPKSDITATSDLSPQFNGTVQININKTDLNRAIVPLPATVVDSSKEISSSCTAIGRNSFTVTGRGGLPASPQEALNPTVGWIDWRHLASQEVRKEDSSNFEQSPIRNHPVSEPVERLPIVEATGWIIASDGTVELVTQSSVKAITNSNLSVAGCLNR